MDDSLEFDNIRRELEKIYLSKLEDENIPVDIDVYYMDSVFSVSFGNGLRTGVGDLKHFLQKNINPFLKVRYNGVILNIEQTNEFIKEYR